MRAVLKFDLSNEDDLHDARIFANAKSTHYAVQDVFDYLRTLTKYNSMGLNEDSLCVVHSIRDEIVHMLSESELF